MLRDGHVFFVRGDAMLNNQGWREVQRLLSRALTPIERTEADISDVLADAVVGEMISRHRPADRMHKIVQRLHESGTLQALEDWTAIAGVPAQSSISTIEEQILPLVVSFANDFARTWERVKTLADDDPFMAEVWVDNFDERHQGGRELISLVMREHKNHTDELLYALRRTGRVVGSGRVTRRQ